QRPGNSEDHPQLAGPDTVASGSWRAHQFQRKNEQRRGDQISDFDDVLGDLHLDHGFFVRLDLNILSIRSVIRKPPTTLLVAATIAIVPSTVEKVLLCAPTSRIAPTTAIASNAFVNDISGVWSRGDTRRITSNPMKAASMKTYRSVIKSNFICLVSSWL